jgi:hypothetical protein
LQTIRFCPKGHHDQKRSEIVLKKNVAAEEKRRGKINMGTSVYFFLQERAVREPPLLGAPGIICKKAASP